MVQIPHLSLAMVDYRKRLIPVIRYLENNFNEPSRLVDIATQANLSPYHFHRIFKAVTGETLADYVRRLRLENAADDLFKKQCSVTDAALTYGFSSSQALAKAFQQHFGLTPSDFKNCEDLRAFGEMLRNSKIGHTLRNSGNEAADVLPYSDPDSTMERMDMETKQFEPGFLAYIRVTGPYGENYEPAIRKLYQWAGAKGLSGFPSIFVYHDNPELTPAEKCRTDIGMLLPEQTETTGEVELTAFQGGSYGVHRGKASCHEDYSKHWAHLIGEIIKSGLDTDDRPCFELYHSYDPETHESDVTFCTAVKV
ncbi:AraC family transcriptional regulator [Parasalinivibrio latis]|uniref:AraC family transcriptional regulator n=1 Tax=Parasalinivibrio latis TaxID=2952610 RepID=UPI0030DE9339